MNLFRPAWRDPTTGERRHSKVWWPQGQYKGRFYRVFTCTGNRRAAQQGEAGFRAPLAEGEVVPAAKEPVPTLSQFAPRFINAIEVTCSSKPLTVKFYRQKLEKPFPCEPLASIILDRIDEAPIESYEQARAGRLSRRGMFFSKVSINRELAMLRRLLRPAQEWKVIDPVPPVRLLHGERVREFACHPGRSSSTAIPGRRC